LTEEGSLLELVKYNLILVIKKLKIFNPIFKR
jgi:hypothetical protein